MPALLSKTLKRRIVFPVRLLERGQTVADLHQALELLGFKVDQRETKAQSFGRLTRQAVTAFQTRHNLAPTGEIDETTANRLNEVLSLEGFLPAKSRPFGDRAVLHLKLRDSERFDPSARDFVRQRLNAELKESILRQFQAPTEALQTAVHEMELDYEALIDQPLSAVLMDRVIPTLLDRPELENEIEKQSEHGFLSSDQRVREVLALDQDVRQHPLFREEARRAKSAALGRIVDLTPKQIEAIEDLDLDATEAETWERLVANGVFDQRTREALENTVEFAKLTNDQFEVIELLRAEERRAPRDLIPLDKSDWRALLERHEITPPEGDDLETYATLLNENVQRAFRTPYLMHRLVERRQDSVLNRTADLDPLLARNELIFVQGQINKDLDWGEISGEQRLRLETSLGELNRFANTYRYLGVAGILNDRALTSVEKQRAIRAKRSLLQTFQRNNPNLDLEWVNTFGLNSRLGRAFQPRWDDISEADLPQVRETIMAFQRTQRLTENFEESEALLASGFNSAAAILKIPEAELGKRTNLEDAAARRIYRKAADVAVLSGHALSVITESTTHANFLPDLLKEGANGPNLEIINVLKNIDGYQDLFGNQNYCRCEHCRSILSPAAYFVDLMDFVHANVSESIFVAPGKTEHPLYLRNRRPDLWNLALTCKNTDRLVPYLTIVNEVLEQYLQKVFEEDDIYEALTKGRLSFHQPFNLPFQALKLYLSHFGIPLSEVYNLFSLSTGDPARASLGCAPEELETIVTPNIEEILVRYSLPINISGLEVETVRSRANISRQELERLLKLEFIKGGLLFAVKVESPAGDLVGFTETMRVRSVANGKALTTADPLLRHFLDRLHRFIRLWRLLPWNPEELHLVITSLMDAAALEDVLTGPTLIRTEALGRALDEEVIIHIASLRLFQERFNLPFEELATVYHEIPILSLEPDKPSLYARLFGELDTLQIRHPALNSAEESVITSDFGLLQGALRLPEAQVVELILLALTTQTIQNAVFSRADVSRLYRHARLARLLGIGIQDLPRVKELLGLPATVKHPTQRLPHLVALLSFKEALDEIPFSLSEVQWLVSGITSGGAGPRVEQTHVDQLLERSRSDPMLFFTSDSFSSIEGITLTQAQGLLAKLAEEPLKWVARVDGDEERYRLTEAYGLNPDTEPVATFLISAGHSAETADRKANEIRQKLSQHHPHTIFTRHLTEEFNITKAYLEALRPFLATDPDSESFVTLLFTWLQPNNETETEVLLNLMRALEQTLFLFQEKLGMSRHTLSFIASNPALFALTLPFALSWDTLRLVSAYADFRTDSVSEPKELHQALASWTGTEFPQSSWPQLVLLLKTDLAQISSILGNLRLPVMAIDTLVALRKALKLAAKLGLNGAALQKITANDYSGLKSASGLVFGAIRAKYEEKEWSEIIEPYEEKLNEIKRDALVDRILSKEFQLKFKDTRELYQFFLLDVEMEGCARVSRVLEAISACQLYVHRCRINLEQSESGDVHVLPDRIPEDEWLWRKSYRVWEANRKVFLYPENWLEPDLRDDKTSIFRQVESELLQSTITPDAIEKIYRNYLREYGEIAKLIVVYTLYDGDEDAYLFFARTQDKPYQYYWRKLLRGIEWTPWERIELEIEPRVLSAHKHHGRLYLFWIRVLTSKDKEEHAGTTYIEDNQTIYLEYSFLESSGRWATAQRIPFHYIKVITFDDQFSGELETVPKLDVDNVAPGFSKKRPRALLRYEKVYVDTPPNKNQIRLLHVYSPDVPDVRADLAEYTNAVKLTTEGLGVLSWSDFLQIGTPPHVALSQVIFVTLLQTIGFSGEAGYEASLVGDVHADARVVTNVFPHSLKAQLSIVHHRIGDFVLSIDQQQFFIRYIGGEGYRKVSEADLGVPGRISPEEYAIAVRLRKRDTLRLSTTLADELGNILFSRGLEHFLSLETQKLDEARIKDVVFEWISELMPPMDARSQAHLNFRGAQGLYFQELFFHLPFLIAHYLNATQKFAEADYWYRRIFDPTASENPEPKNKTDRNWRYIDFRNRPVPKLHAILTDEDAIERYKEDPFNPFAIARLRLVAFQKGVVMKYIDNLLDWGDSLFAQDTVESINEATMLYILAADILGDRPREVGDCETIAESSLTYQNIISRQRLGSEFLIELENLQLVARYQNLEGLEFLGGDDDDEADTISAGFVALRSRSPRFKGYSEIKKVTKQPAPVSTTLAPRYKVAAKTSAETAEQRTLAFCIPPNDKLLGYWDRVEDRLFKIRNCMNLQGVRRELALFQAPIEPGLLVKAKAAGLSLEEALGLLPAEVPPYRFAYLLEKAKQFAGTVQSFGASLLSALEKKDTEELILLRAVHEHDLLGAVREVKNEAITESIHTKSGLEEGKKSATKRKVYYTNLLTQAIDPELAISKNEQDSLNKQEDAKESEDKSSKREQGAAGINAAPTIGFHFSPFVFMVPFHPLGESPLRSNLEPLTISFNTSNISSALSASASKFRTESSFRHIESNRSATRAAHERRKTEWKHQQELAEQEEKQFSKQIQAAALRIELARKDLAAQEKQIEQAGEVHEFYKDKFTNLGLYTYLATSLARLYRDAYNLAHAMSMKAQRAYQFETDDQTFFIAPDNWQADKAGFVAGERLILQLQRMEESYLNQNRREHEITLPCSVGQIDPLALLELRATGSCDFSIPEVWFDLYYPGQYKRRIKSIRVSIPCVIGPFTNVGAKLTLTRSQIRHEPQLGPTLIEVPQQRNTSVVMSTGNNDTGVFELNFRDERYLPFEGAGAVSDWHLELPSQLRPFDYYTISDVILQISYTTKEDGRFKGDVESELVDRFKELASGEGLSRSYSLKREFASALNQLQHPLAGTPRETEIRLDKRHFPYFLRDQTIELVGATLILQPKETAAFNISGLELVLNNDAGGQWLPFPDNNNSLMANSFEINEPLNSEGNTWSLKLLQGDLFQLQDMWLIVGYRIN